MAAPEIICLLNGITDVPLEDLGGVTPLQKASHPALDWMAQRGTAWRVGTPNLGGHETSLLELLGVHDALETAREGPLTAIAMGYALGPLQRAYSVQLVSCGRDTIVDVADNLLRDSEGRALCKALNGALASEGCHFLHLEGCRAVMVTNNPSLRSPAPSRPTSPTEVLGKGWQKVLPKGVDKRGVRRLLERAMEVLAHHEVNQVRSELEEQPVNGLWLKGGGPGPSWDPLESTDAMVHTFDPLLAGVARSCGVPIWRLPLPDSKFGLFRTILGGLDHAMSQCTRLIIDVPNLWNATLRGELLEKVKTIEWIDRHFISPLLDYCRARSYRCTVMPLRRTDIRRGAILPGWVPAVTYPASRPVHAPAFNEEVFASLPNTSR